MTKCRIQLVESGDVVAVREFAALPRKIYGAPARCFGDTAAGFLGPAAPQNPFLEDRCFQAFAVRTDNGVVARAIALLDLRYQRRWNQKLGHIVMFEAVETERDCSLMLLDHACAWLRARGCTSVRAGFGPLETGFLIDNYEVLRPGMMRHSAPHYHAILKQAGFEIENGGSEYVVPLAGNSALFFEGNLDRASGRGYRIATLASLSADQRVADVSKTWNVVFSSHWGLAPMTQLEIDTLLHNPVSGDILTLSALAYSDNNPVGIVLAATEKSWRRGMFFASRYSVQSLNSFAVGVCETHRGCGIATALASHSYLALIARGAKLLSYGLILADNLASRAAALKLGARCSSNYVTYCARPL